MTHSNILLNWWHRLFRVLQILFSSSLVLLLVLFAFFSGEQIFIFPDSPSYQSTLVEEHVYTCWGDQRSFNVPKEIREKCLKKRNEFQTKYLGYFLVNESDRVDPLKVEEILSWVQSIGSEPCTGYPWLLAKRKYGISGDQCTLIKQLPQEDIDAISGVNTVVVKATTEVVKLKSKFTFFVKVALAWVFLLLVLEGIYRVVLYVIFGRIKLEKLEKDSV